MHGAQTYRVFRERRQRMSVGRAMPRLFVGFLALLLLACAAHAAESIEPRGWLHLNGYSYHLVAKGCNDFLYGTGLTWFTRYSDSLHTAWEADVFADSARKPAAYAGYSVGFPFHGITLGATGAIMYHRNFIAEDRFRILPVAVPFLEIGGRKLKARVYYVPPVRRASDEQICVQLLIPLWR